MFRGGVGWEGKDGREGMFHSVSREREKLLLHGATLEIVLGRGVVP